MLPQCSFLSFVGQELALKVRKPYTICIFKINSTTNKWQHKILEDVYLCTLSILIQCWHFHLKKIVKNQNHMIKLMI